MLLDHDLPCDLNGITNYLNIILGHRPGSTYGSVTEYLSSPAVTHPLYLGHNTDPYCCIHSSVQQELALIPILHR